MAQQKKKKKKNKNRDAFQHVFFFHPVVSSS
jgi:hypothetical protein